MTSDRLDPVVMAWLNDDVEAAPREGLANALVAAESVTQRPGWTFPQRWLPGPLVGFDGRPSSAARIGILVALTLLVLLAVAVALVGSRPTQLPVGPVGDVFAFQDGDSIAVAARDEAGKRQVSGTVPFGRNPVFSPDGKLIAFVAPAAHDSRDGLLMVVPFDGSALPIDVGHGLALTPSQTNEFSWSPDSSRLVFSAVENGQTKLFVVAANGSGSLEGITDGTTAADLPSWNKFGTSIAYRSKDPDGVHTSIVLINEDGTRPLQRTGVVAADAFISRPRVLSVESYDDAGNPVWVLSYSKNEGFGTATLAAIDPGTGPINPLPLTPQSPVTNWEGGLPWSPDGSKVAILTDGDGLVLADRDPGFNGTAHPYIGQIGTFGNLIACWVEWSPDGSYLYGGSPGSCDHVVVVPLADPAAAQTLPVTVTGPASWRPQADGDQP